MRPRLPAIYHFQLFNFKFSIVISSTNHFRSEWLLFVVASPEVSSVVDSRNTGNPQATDIDYSRVAQVEDVFTNPTTIVSKKKERWRKCGRWMQVIKEDGLASSTLLHLNTQFLQVIQMIGGFMISADKYSQHRRLGGPTEIVHEIAHLSIFWRTSKAVQVALAPDSLPSGKSVSEGQARLLSITLLLENHHKLSASQLVGLPWLKQRKFCATRHDSNLLQRLSCDVCE